jgi:thymidylate synthase (FAD)
MRSQMTDMMYHTDTDQHKQNIACFRIKVPIFVARQFMRHRSFSYLEMSRRYTKGSKVPFEFWFPETMLGRFYTKDQSDIWVKEHNNLIGIGLETQVASRFLPQTTYTEFYIMGEVEGIRNFLNLRLDSYSQAEIRECAEAMLELLEKHQPELAKKVTP